MAKVETFKGRTIDEWKKLSLTEYIQLLPSRQRRTLKRGFTEAQKEFLKKVKAGKNNIETHCRDMVIIPDMVEKTIKVYSGKDFIPVMITVEMLGHRLGEFVMTRKRVMHHAPGIGATRSSASLSVR